MRVPVSAVAVRFLGAPGRPEVAVVVPVDAADHGPSPAELTARTSTSYCVPPLRSVRVWLKAPVPVHARLTTVQFLSALLGASLRMWRRS